MKKIVLSIIILSVSISAGVAQTTSFDVDGIKVIFKPTVKEIINVRMFYRGGVSNYPASKAGIERFALTAAIECGTKKYSGEAYRDVADKYGINMNLAAEYDYGGIEMECVSKYFNEGWDLFTEAVMTPVFDNNEVNLLRNKIIAAIRQDRSDPDKRTDRLIVENAFAGTPYATDPDGDEEVIRSLTPADLKAYYSGILNKNQLFIVVAGKISKEELIAKIKTSFAAIPSRPYTATSYTEPVWNDNKVLIEKQGLATNYINAIMNAPPVNSEDYTAYRVGLSAFGGVLFSELRTKLNLSYDPGAYAVMKQMPYALMYVSTTNPKEAVQVMTDQLNRVKKSGLTKNGLKNLKSGYITNNYIRQQSSSAITENLGIAEVMGGWEKAENLPAMIDSLTVDQINQVLNKYIVGLRWSYLGNPEQAADAQEAFKNPVK